VFFFQAEDGIRDKLVTGVQTCALPICPVWWLAARRATIPDVIAHELRCARLARVGRSQQTHGIGRDVRRDRHGPGEPLHLDDLRSEERRVGKEWRAGGLTLYGKKKGKR